MWHFYCCPREIDKISCQTLDFLFFVSLLWAFFLFRWVIALGPHYSLSHHTLLSGKGTLICHSSVVWTRDQLPRWLIPHRRIIILVMAWGMSLIGNQGRQRCLMGQGTFPETTNHPSERPLHLRFLLPLFPLSMCYHNVFLLLFSSKFETLDFWMKSVSYQCCKNQKLLWSPFPKNCFCPWVRLRNDMAEPFSVQQSCDEQLQ